ncbi:hypothetical protein ABT288_43385 [Streptomyces sp. NPDC001093]
MTASSSRLGRAGTAATTRASPSATATGIEDVPDRLSDIHLAVPAL